MILIGFITILYIRLIFTTKFKYETLDNIFEHSIKSDASGYRFFREVFDNIHGAALEMSGALDV